MYGLDTGYLWVIYRNESSDLRLNVVLTVAIGQGVPMVVVVANGQLSVFFKELVINSGLIKYRRGIILNVNVAYGSQRKE